MMPAPLIPDRVIADWTLCVELLTAQTAELQPYAAIERQYLEMLENALDHLLCALDGTLERMLHTASEPDRLNILRGFFHDFQSPISLMTGVVTVMLEDTACNSNLRLHDHLEAMQLVSLTLITSVTHVRNTLFATP